MQTVSQWLRAVAVVCALLCASCLTMSLPKSARVEPNAPPSRTESTSTTDSRLMDTWELMYQVNEKNSEEQPRPGTRTLIEFKEPGRVVFSRIEREKESDVVNRREGDFTVRQSEIHITDDAGNSVRWPYQITGDTLIIAMPNDKRKFYWKRCKPKP